MGDLSQIFTRSKRTPAIFTHRSPGLNYTATGICRIKKQLDILDPAGRIYHPDHDQVLPRKKIKAFWLSHLQAFGRIAADQGKPRLFPS